jgi:flagella basal body P-ring formation protein FlgA
MWTAILLLQTCLTVPGDRILARDLAPGLPALAAVPPETFLGYAPLPGVERRLTRKDLERVLGPGASSTVLPSSVCVVRNGQPMNGEQILLAMRRALPEDAELELIQFPKSVVPPGRPEFAIAGLRKIEDPGLYVWRGRWIPEPAGRSIAIAVQVRIRLRRSVFVAARDLEPGAELTPADWVTEQREVAVPFQNPLPEDYRLTGCRPRRRIAAGQPLKQADLIPPEAARAGQVLTLVSGSGAARIVVEAQALTSGRLGDLILVKSPLNGKRLRARLADHGLAIAERQLP